MIVVILWRTCSLTADSFSNQCLEANMGEIIRFVPKSLSASERALIGRGPARMYDSIFPAG